MNSDATCTGVFGRRGSGKTTLVQRLIRKLPRVVVFDPMGSYPDELQWPATDRLAPIAKLASTRAGKLVYVPPPGMHAEALHELAVRLWNGQKGAPPLTLVIEEADRALPSAPLPRKLYGAAHLVLQGRHRGVSIIAVSQRPALVAPTFRGNCAHLYLFALAYLRDRQELGQLLGPGGARELANLPDHSFVRWHSGEVSRGRNPPKR